MHDGKYAAYVRVSTDAQDVANQEHGIKAYLNGGDFNVKWYREEGVSSGEDWHNRKELHRCLDYCRKKGATLVIYSISRMSRRDWETLRFFEQEILPGKIKLVVVDDPTLDETTIGFKAMFAQHERTQIKQRTKLALGRIKSEIAEKGSYTSKAGNVITKLGVHENLEVAGMKGVASSIAKADARASDVWPIIQNLLTQGASLRSIERHGRGYTNQAPQPGHIKTHRMACVIGQKLHQPHGGQINEKPYPAGQ
jgi:DNA invertase Pin-like site-specific DNA recombinase